ncbi:TRAP transporter small permease [Glutamicibacter sp. Je.9.36]|jgi:TRAP-type C4-dicarboxylate transport system permease small subunit|uniref:TRAP transporter small permease n=1 Tax=Glutamicibacter sp. Je.9.36 TaxID=3142837 RepID=UPI003DA80ABF
MLKLTKILEWLISGLAGLALLAMMLLSLANALGRTWFQSPIYGANEITANWLLPALVLLAIPGAQVWKEHINVALVIENLSNRSLSWVRLFSCLAGAALSALLAWYGLQEALAKTEVQATGGITSIPIWPAYYFVPLGFTLTTLVLLIDAWLGFTKPEHEINTGTGKPTAELQPDSLVGLK